MTYILTALTKLEQIKSLSLISISKYAIRNNSLFHFVRLINFLINTGSLYKQNVCVEVADHDKLFLLAAVTQAEVFFQICWPQAIQIQNGNVLPDCRILYDIISSLGKKRYSTLEMPNTYWVIGLQNVWSKTTGTTLSFCWLPFEFTALLPLWPRYLLPSALL